MPATWSPPAGVFHGPNLTPDPETGLGNWTEEQIVSSDIIGRSESSIVDLSLTQIVDGDLLKIFAWYDNEWAYSVRCTDMAKFLVDKGL